MNSELIKWEVKIKMDVEPSDWSERHKKLNKVLPDATSRILREGGVTEQADSIWLLDFWGKKDVAGIILMPLTRHQTLHLNDCDKWKKIIRTRKKFFAK